MPFYHKLGTIPHKRHIQFRKPNGELYYEQLFGTVGFDGMYSNMYHIHRPTQVKEIIHTIPHDLDHMYYSPFSPRWCFTFDGCTTNKGAIRVFYDKIDEELILRLQHRPKQGLFFRLREFIGLTAEQIGNESLLRDIIKMTAICWTRCIYRYPPLANAIWQLWRASLSIELQQNQPENIPK